MIPFTDMITEDLEYLKKRFSTEVDDIQDDIDTRQTRLNTRLQRQAQDAVAQTELQTALTAAETMLAELQAANASASSIATAQAVVDERQAESINLTASPSYVSDREAHVIQLEIDVLEQAKVVRNTRIGEIDSALGN